MPIDITAAIMKNNAKKRGAPPIFALLIMVGSVRCKAIPPLSYKARDTCGSSLRLK
jgi:hypothetical protein